MKLVRRRTQDIESVYRENQAEAGVNCSRTIGIHEGHKNLYVDVLVALSATLREDDESKTNREELLRYWGLVLNYANAVPLSCLGTL